MNKYPEDQHASEALMAASQFRLVYVFDLQASSYRGEAIADLAPVMEEVSAMAGHLPKWWGVSAQDRETLAEMHRSAKLWGTSIVSLDMDATVPKPEAERLATLLSEVASAKAGKQWLVGQGDFSCRFGYGGTRDHVVAQLQALETTQHAIRLAQIASSRPRPK